MRYKFLLSTLLATLFLSYNVFAETEPNNTAGTANVFTLNGNASGTINGATIDQDWYKVTTTGDGLLSLTLTPATGNYIRMYLYDADGTTLINSGYSNAAFTINTDGLAAGTYYIQIRAYNDGETINYGLTNTFTAPTQANDAEPNGTKAQAKVLPLNGTKTGHTGYYYSLNRDTLDWYKVTLPSDGNLRLRLTSNNGQYVYFELFDNDGITNITTSYTNGTGEFTASGLAAGIYYVRIRAYNTNGFAPYTLSDSLFVATPANDAEPNDTKAQSLTLAPNSSTTGHIGYYYQNTRDLYDWYKITTPSDGNLTLKFTSYNGQYIYYELFDNDGVTSIVTTYTNGTGEFTQGGLAAGTYYVRIRPYNVGGFAPYTLSDSLYVPAQVNDAEPDSTKAQALVLPVNGSTTGHIGYYYKSHRDTLDWYKITLPQDGALHLTLTSHNGVYLYFELFDNDGVTPVNISYTNGTGDTYTDGLGAGTYYIRIRTYNVGDYAPYTLKDSLSIYSGNDNEPNKYAKQAATLFANQANYGHVNFYYNKVKDSIDWHKINYTGTDGDMSVTFSVSAHYYNGDTYAWIQIYKDTAASPIYSSYTNSTLTANLTALTAGYYYVKIYAYNSSSFSVYNITPTFTQTKVKVTLVTADTSVACDNNNSITIKCKASSAPYTAQLYRYNQPYGNAETIKNTKNFVFDNLPNGNYYVKVYGDGATGNAFDKTSPIELMPKPVNARTTNVQNTQAKLNWDGLSCASYFSVQYRKSSASSWTTVNTTGNTTSLIIKSLSASTKYYWRVVAADSSKGVTGLSAYTDSISFTTPASFTADVPSYSDENSIAKSMLNAVNVYPNPATNYFRIQLNGISNTQLSAVLRNMNGNIVWNKMNVNASILSGTNVDVSKLLAGNYVLQLIDENGKIIGSKKIIVSK